MTLTWRPIQTSKCCASVAAFVAALLRVWHQFRLVFTGMLRMLRVRGEGKGAKGGYASGVLPRPGRS